MKNIIRLLSVTIVGARYIEQSAIDEFAACWRRLSHGHGEHVDVEYACDCVVAPGSDGFCRLNIASCPTLAIAAAEPDVSGEIESFVGSDEEFNVSVELRHNTTDMRYHLMVKDHVNQGFVAEGMVGVPMQARRRQLSLITSLNSLGGAVDPSWSGLAELDLFGLRRDCNSEPCPERWANCWPGSNSGKIQIQVFMVLDKSFCAEFDSIPKCETYTLGVFRDMNLVFESQVGLSLRPAYLLPPDAFKRFWPEVAGSVRAQADANAFLTGFQQAFSCGDAKFRRVIGRPRSDFSVFHLLVGPGITFTRRETSGPSRDLLGVSSPNTVCKCEAAGVTRFVHDRHPSETWLTLAHEIAHNFNAQHYFEILKIQERTDPNAGIMGYGDGTVSKVYAFSDVHREQFCGKLRQVMADPTTAGCLTPYFSIGESDPRYGPPVIVYIVILTILVLVIVLGCVIYWVHYFRYKRLYRRYVERRRVHKLNLASYKKLKEEYTQLEQIIVSPKPQPREMRKQEDTAAKATVNKSVAA